MTERYHIYHTAQEVFGKLSEIIVELRPASVHVVTDTNVARLVLPTFNIAEMSTYPTTVIEAGDSHKSIDQVMRIWQALSNGGATRRSLVVNIGGGMVTDLGGFAAATFKRGIPFINISTTLLGAVDASIGGKTGINFNGLKNEVGAFADPLTTLVATDTLTTLPAIEVLSGYGEVLKTALLDGDEMYALARRSIADYNAGADIDAALIAGCLRFKSEIVEQDPHEKGIRKCLNLGHTAGHAFESLMMQRGTPVLHGIAVAHGLLVALLLSHSLMGLDSNVASGYASLLREYFPMLHITCKDYDKLLSLMGHDKKNDKAGELNFSLLQSVGTPKINVTATRRDVESALDIYRELLGI